jgi:hypothetical protein
MKKIRMITAVLDALPFVRRDRFITAKTDRTTYVVYGWIDSDFVVLIFKFKPYHLTFITSCTPRAKEIGYALFGEDYQHHPCQPIRDLK